MVLLGGLEFIVGGVILNEVYKNEKKKETAEKRRPRRHSDEHLRPKRRDSWERLKHKNKLPQKPLGQQPGPSSSLSKPPPGKQSTGPSRPTQSANGYLAPIPAYGRPAANAPPGPNRVGSAPPPGYYPSTNLNAQYQPLPNILPPNSNNYGPPGQYRYEQNHASSSQTPQYPPPPRPQQAVPSGPPTLGYYPPPPQQSPYSQHARPATGFIPMSPQSVASTASTQFEPPAGFVELPGSSGFAHPNPVRPSGRRQSGGNRVHFEDGLDSQKRPVTPPPPYREY